MKKLTEALRQGRYGLWLSGTQQELDTLFDMYPSLREFYPDEKHLSLHPSTLLELTRRFFYQLKAWDLHPDSEASKMLTDAIRRGYNDGTITHWTTANINRFYQEKVLKAYLSRLADTASSFAKDELRQPCDAFGRPLDVVLSVLGRHPFWRLLWHSNRQDGLQAHRAETCF